MKNTFKYIFLSSLYIILFISMFFLGCTAIKEDIKSITYINPEVAKRLAQNILDDTGVEGGLVVHLGCGKGRLTTALFRNERYLVHGLSRDRDNIERAREYIQSQGLYGNISVEHWDKEYLPYSDNLVDLLISDDLGDITQEEIMRVLSPEGVAYIKEYEEWKKKVKPKPKGIDEWSHFLHGPNNNAVSQDSLVGPPRYLQWVGGPRWMRSHEHLASISAVVSSGGRIFSIVDNGPTSFIALPSDWYLVARDAYNGIVLWKRKIDLWAYHLRILRSGPPDLQRRLVAIDNIVYVTLGYGKPITALDAATGKILKTYYGTEGALEIIHNNGVLYVVTGKRSSLKPHVNYQELRKESFRKLPAIPFPHKKSVLAIEEETGKILWRKSDSITDEVMPTTLCVEDGRLFFQNQDEIICLDSRFGNLLWRTGRKLISRRLGWSTPTLVVHDGILFSADREGTIEEGELGNMKWIPIEEDDHKEHFNVNWIPSGRGMNAPPGKLIALSAKTGDKLWSCKCREGYNAPVDVLIANNLLWTGDIVSHSDSGITKGRDPETGEVKMKRPPDQKFYKPGMGHHRCYRNKATNRYILTSRAGIEFIDLHNGKAIPHHWIRGSCQYGVLPCNGLLYAPPHSCACYIRAKLDGFNALASNIERPNLTVKDGGNLQRGPAFGKVSFITEDDINTGEWPTYRHDIKRSGHTESNISADLTIDWELKLDGELTSPVAAYGQLYVCSTDRCMIYALDADSGKLLWEYTAGGPIDSPPTIYNGLVLFGSSDGKVYCLRASDGGLVWHFRSGPEDRRIISYGRLESAWPIHGSVLLKNGSLYFAAGRSSFLDGGIYLYRLDPITGEKLSMICINSRDPETGYQPKGAVLRIDACNEIAVGALSDILSSDGSSIYMRHKRFNKELEEQPPNISHLFSPTGFLDDSWWHRSYWIIGKKMDGGCWGWFRAGGKVPSGRILVFNDSTIFGFGRNVYIHNSSHVGFDTLTKYRLFRINRNIVGNSKKCEWSNKTKVLVRAMVLTSNTLFIVGPPYIIKNKDNFGISHLTEEQLDPLTGKKLSIKEVESQAHALQGDMGAILQAVSADDGRVIAEYRIKSLPVFDGMISSNNRIYITTKDSKILCFKEK